MGSIYERAARGRLKLRLALNYLPGLRLFASSQPEQGAIGDEHRRSAEHLTASETATGESLSLGGIEPTPENREPMRRRIRRYVRTSRFSRWLRDMRQKYFSPPTAEDLRLRDKEKQRRALEALLIEQMKTARRRMINRLTDLGVCHVSSEERNRRIDRVRMDIGRVTPNEILFRVTHYPAGVTIQQLVADDICTSLSEAVGRPVTGWYTKGKEDLGVFFSIALAGSDGLPDTYAITEMLRDFPSTAAPLTLPFGVRSNGSPLFFDLADIYHLLVAGTTGNGKTNFLHTVICTLINRNSPETVQLDLMDFKDQGIEFACYEGIKHLRTGRIINDPEKLDEYFALLTAEMNIRFGILKKHKKRKISEYNRHRTKNRMPYLVVIIDELAQVVNQLGQERSDKVLNKIASQGRAAGILLIVATQYPRSDVISTVVTSNISGRVCFHLQTQDQSRVVIQSGHAYTDIPDNARGRAIVIRGGQEYLVQTALITERQINHIVASAKSGEHVQDLGIAVDPEELIRWAMEQNYNRLTFDSLFDYFRKREIPRDDLYSLVTSMDGQEYEISGTLYRVVNRGGSAGRRVELVDAPAEETNTGGADPETPEGENRGQTVEAFAFADGLRAVLAAYDCQLIDGTIQGPYINLLLDETIFDDELQPKRAAERRLADDLNALCGHYIAHPVPGGFEIDGKAVTL